MQINDLDPHPTRLIIAYSAMGITLPKDRGTKTVDQSAEESFRGVF
jgi:hypothetical protein